MSTGQETGHISIHAENILPIIKRWLYSEKEIFIRELIANASDAMTKLAKLALVGDVHGDVPEARITVSIDKTAKTLTITDTGLGLTAEEIKKYINQVAFSGVQDFVAKYQGKDDDQQIIGHFGLGFYSSYMVAGSVEIDSLSYQQGAAAAHWKCDGSTEFVLNHSSRKEVGTAITLHIAEDSLDMLEEGTIRGLLNKYCAFIRYPIYLNGQVVNDPVPLWNRSPSELSDKDYTDFFHKLFPGCADPLFWIHLNVDYPFKLKGILYFPRVQNEFDASQGQVKLYCNQVFVADNCKELVPEFLLLLKGALDCPDLPLNVSRSYLQNDQTVRLISQHISKKVADKLSGMAKTDAENFQKFWGDIHAFVKFGMLKDSKFYERMIDHIIFKCASGRYQTFAKYAEGKGDSPVTVIYASDESSQAALIRMVRDAGLDVMIADAMIDMHLLPYVEMQSGRKYKFLRVDADLSHHLVEANTGAQILDPKDQKSASEKIDEIFRKNLSREKVKIRVESLKSSKIPAMLTVDENMRRFADMSRVMGGGADAPWKAGLGEEFTLVVNRNNPAIQNLLQLAGAFNREAEMKMIVEQVFDLAWLQMGGQAGKFTPEMLQAFIDRSSGILERLGSGGPATPVG